MKLLLDQNLSPRLVHALDDIFPGSRHVQSCLLSTSRDIDVLDFAQRHQLILVSKDSDFVDPQLLRGSAVKCIWIRRGNCSTTEVEMILRKHVPDIQRLASSPDLSLLMLY